MGAATENVSAVITALRNEKKRSQSGYRQEDVAARAGIPLGTYKQIERGNVAIDADQLFAIASALRTPVSTLARMAEERGLSPPKGETRRAGS